MNSVLKMMNSALTTLNFASKTLNSAFQTMNFASKMHLCRSARHAPGTQCAVWVARHAASVGRPKDLKQIHNRSRQMKDHWASVRCSVRQFNAIQLTKKRQTVESQHKITSKQTKNRRKHCRKSIQNRTRVLIGQSITARRPFSPTQKREKNGRKTAHLQNNRSFLVRELEGN